MKSRHIFIIELMLHHTNSRNLIKNPTVQEQDSALPTEED